MPVSKRIALPANVTIAPAVCHTLAHPTTSSSYDFRPQGDVVQVTHINGRHHDTYCVPADEARVLWRRLRTEGYERF